MTLAQACEIFGSGSNLAKALGVTKQAVYKWPEILSQRRSDEITGACLRLGLMGERAKVMKKNRFSQRLAAEVNYQFD